MRSSDTLNVLNFKFPTCLKLIQTHHSYIQYSVRNVSHLVPSHWSSVLCHSLNIPVGLRLIRFVALGPGPGPGPQPPLRWADASLQESTQVSWTRTLIHFIGCFQSHARSAGPPTEPDTRPPPLPRTHRYPRAPHQPSIQRGGGRRMSAASNDLNTKLPLKNRQLLFILLSVVVVLEWPCSGCSGSVQTGTHVENTLRKHKHVVGYSKHFSEHLEGARGLRAEILLFSMEFCM